MQHYGPQWEDTVQRWVFWEGELLMASELTNGKRFGGGAASDGNVEARGASEPTDGTSFFGGGVGWGLLVM